MLLSVSAALDDRDLLAPHFVGPSWSTWRAVLRAAERLPLDDDQRARFRAVAEREPPGKRVRELWAVVGRRGGKDSIASAIATVAALGDYRGLLRPGEKATVMCLACDRDQAKIVHRYISGYFNTVPLLQALAIHETNQGLQLNNGVEIVVATNSFRSVRGRTIVCVIFDEAAYWRDDEFANPDVETYNAVLPSLVTLPGSMLVGISTPYRRSGLLFDRWRRYYGKGDADVLVVKGPSTTLVPQRLIDAEMERDPEVANAEWMAEWRSDLADFVARDAVDAAVVPDRFELPPVNGLVYSGFVDPSGAAVDSMTLGIAHRDRDGRGLLDALREVRPPFSPEAVVAEFADLLRSYRVGQVTGDHWGGEWPREQFAKHGIRYVPSDKVKSAIYLEFLPLLNSGRVELLDHPRLISQLCSLERRTARGGKDSIDHPKGAHDDVVNSAAGALVLAAAGPPGFHISDEQMARLRAGTLVRTPPRRRIRA